MLRWKEGGTNPKDSESTTRNPPRQAENRSRTRCYKKNEQ